MSLNKSLTSEMESVLSTFFDSLASKYKIDRDALTKEWNSSSKSSKPSLASVDMDDISPLRLSKCNKKELEALCRSRNHKVSGSKQELIGRLTGSEPKKEVKVSEPKPKKVTRADVASSPVIKNLISQTNVIPILTNAFGNLEHPETSLVFDRKTENVIGKQGDDGTILPITDDDIQLCKKFKFKFNIPENLDTNENLNVADSESDIELNVSESGEEDEEVEESDEDIE